ncbi:keratin, type II cytoskeletal 2 epidermal-like [Canna indica]|uniref:Keratin, type II cytoskeletal 2 epidermal-like n=1 Tax=Canna indica TaxID=4628 RepID=A0AAQ3QTX3_9LILI|nr:keratin, type II cytoskeletal 2 epidermal-like [Canna indica]
MATVNPFDLLGDDDSEDPSQLIAAHQQKIATKKPDAPPAAAPAKLPTKPLPPAQAVREARDGRNTTAPARGGAGRGGPGRGRGGGRGGGMSQNRDFANGNIGGGYRGYEGADGAAGGEDGEARAARQPFSGGRRGGYGGRGGYGNVDAEGDSERPARRTYERRSGTGRGYEMKRNGGGRGNWGVATDETITQEREEIVHSEDKTIASEKQAEQDEVPLSEVNKENKEGVTNEAEEKEEDKEMTLEEYEKVREEKRKALLAMKNEERKVEIDKELQAMKQLSVKKAIDDVFVKLGSDKDAGKKKETADREEKSKKSISITEFLKPAERERYSSGGRGRGRGRGGRGQYGGGGYGSGASTFASAAPSIEDPGQFPTLGGK